MSELFGDCPLLQLLSIDTFEGDIVDSAKAAVQVAFTRAGSAKAARAQNAGVKSRAVVVRGAGFLCKNLDIKAILIVAASEAYKGEDA